MSTCKTKDTAADTSMSRSLIPTKLDGECSENAKSIAGLHITLKGVDSSCYDTRRGGSPGPSASTLFNWGTFMERYREFAIIWITIYLSNNKELLATTE